ncbi:MAG: PQQ-binding-like beta-propeller repeat protein [Planctomycetota bacterium]|nr:PQQ-binding-like beta-propeller repeat protein [Planctomycetota bacterium]
MKSMRALVVFTAVVVWGGSARAENWAQWRGPAFNGSSAETGLPASFSKTENMAWVCPLPGRAGATPIVWDDSIFISSADSKSKDLLALCINRKDGKVRWQRVIAPAADRRPLNGPNNNMCAPSPVTDGKTAWFLYGTGDLAAFDFEGNQIWARNLQKDLGSFAIMWGYGSSPLLYKDKLYIQLLQCNTQVYATGPDRNKPRDSFLLAVDPKTGKDLWKSVRPSDAVGETLESYSTPIPYESAERPEILLLGANYLSGHNPENGAEYWRCDGFNSGKQPDLRIVPSPVSAAGMHFIAAPKRRNPSLAVKAGGSGNITETHSAWKLGKENSPDVCTPLVYKDMLYVLDGGGDKRNVLCLDPKTGAQKWIGQLPGNQTYWVSLTAADGRMYCINEGGQVVVLAAGDEFKLLATVPLGDSICYSSIAIAQKQLFIRTGQNLYCVGK